MRDCPIFEVEITEERSQLVMVAAETKEAAEEAACKISRADLDWFSAYRELGAYARDAEANPWDVRHYGVWVPGLNNGTGAWVHNLDDVPQLPPLPDPNQLVLDLDVTDNALSIVNVSQAL